MKLLIAVPSYGLWEPDFGHSLALSMSDLASHDGPEEIRLIRCEATILPAGRTDLANAALNCGATHILWCDTDMKFKPDNVRALLRHADQDVVAVDYLKRAPPHVPVSEDLDGNPIPEGEGLVEASRIGFGLVLMKADVFRRIPQPWFHFNWNGEDFDGEDVWFCNAARKHGVTIHVDRDASRGIGHVGKFVFEADLWRSQPTRN